MTKQVSLIFLAVLLTALTTKGQETDYGPGYQTVLINNPAFTGSEGDGTLRLSYLNFYPGNNFNLHSVFVSYDSFIPVIHGGAGFFLTDDYMGGIINDLRGGVSYAYHFQADKNIFINAGLAASCYYRGYNIGGIILPDQIDPLNGKSLASGESISEKGHAVFDISTGVMIISERFIAALALNHLAAPDLAGSGSQTDKIERKLVLNLAGKFDLDKNHQIFIRPVIMAESQGRYHSLGAGGSLENNSLSLSAVLLLNSVKDIDLQAGCSLKEGRFLFFYNYRFNIASGNGMVPLSLLHQAGLAFSLNYVDKRKVIKTINFPKL
jgi:type IX secretion system PorP/SprF family membrane protein